MHSYKMKGCLSPKDTLNPFEWGFERNQRNQRNQMDQKDPMNQIDPMNPIPLSTDSVGADFLTPTVSDWTGENEEPYSLYHQEQQEFQTNQLCCAYRRREERENKEAKEHLHCNNVRCATCK